MARKHQKYYVVWEGKEPGIYESWEACKKQVEGYEGAKYKSFFSRQEAEAAFDRPYREFVGLPQPKPSLPESELKRIGKPVVDSICVDGACSGNPGRSEYRGVDTVTGAEFFRGGPFEDGTNNVMEFLGIVHALAFCKERKLDLPIYSDSRNAISWVRFKNPRTKLKRTGRNDKLFELMDRAVAWLQNNAYPNKVLKWETQAWGENPADFGRK